MTMKKVFILIAWVMMSAFLTDSPVFSKESMDSLIDKARKEGKLLWYTSGGLEDTQQINNKFKEKYPFLDVTYIKGTRPNIVARFETETRLKRHLADVLLLGGSDMYLFRKNNLLMKYFPMESEYFPTEAKDPEGFWVVASYNIGSLAYNTKLVQTQDLPKNLNDLLDPKWKKLIVGDPSKIYYFMPLFQYMGEEKAVLYLRKLAPQLVPRKGADLALTLCAAGEYKLVFEVGTKTLDRAMQQGMPLAPFFLEYLRQTTAPPGISANAPHPNAAKLFIDYLLSREGQALLADLNMMPGRIGVKPKGPSLLKAFSLLNDKKVKLIPEKVDWEENAKYYQRLFIDIFKTS